MVGLMDAIVLGRLCTCSSKSHSSGRFSVAMSSSMSPSRMMSQPSFRPENVDSFLSAADDADGGKAELPEDVDVPSQPQSSFAQRLKVLHRRASSALRMVGAWKANATTQPALSGRVGLPGVVRMFVTSWNAGGVGPAEMEAGLPEMLPKWIPLGYELYVVGVQECECLRELKSVIHSYLGGPTSYFAYSRALSDPVPIHGVIAVMVFVVTSHVEEGVFIMQRGTGDRVAAGVNLGPIGRGKNKGMVGMSARYFDCDLALVTAHFAADLKGRNRLYRRNQDACTTLRDLSLRHDSEAFDVHMQHHHVVVLGDLNYRMKSSPEEVLSLVSESAKATITHYTNPGDHTSAADGSGSRGQPTGGSARNSNSRSCASNWREASLAPIFHRHDSRPDDPGPGEKGGGGGRGGVSCAQDWSWVPPLDELSQSMSQKEVFWGFNEGPLTFPPSYRWKRGAHPGDYTDPAHLQAYAYTTSVVAAEPAAPASLREVDEGGASDYSSGVPPLPSKVPSWVPPPSSSLRTPSYTDRVLTHSLPGCQGGLRWRHYNMADGVTLSDHRPVVAAIDMPVDLSVRGFCYHSPRDTRQKRGVSQSSSSSFLETFGLKRSPKDRRDDVVRFKVYLSNPHFQPAVLSMPMVEPGSLDVLFPLVSQDPHALIRKAESLLEVVGTNVGNTDPRHINKGTDQATCSRAVCHLRSFPWSSFPVKHKILGSLRFSQHMLFKVNARLQGLELGQGVVMVKDYIGRDAKRAVVELSSGGIFQGYLSVDLKVVLPKVRS